MKNKLQLTSVKVVSEEYKKFKAKCLDTNLTLQELVNVSLFLYNRNSGYDKLIHETAVSGSVI